MGLDAAVYADDDCETEITSVRIGNVDAVVRLRKTIEEKIPEARVLLTKVLYSGTHCGDSLTLDEIASVKVELGKLAQRCPGDNLVKEFVADFGPVLSTAVIHGRPITFT